MKKKQITIILSFVGRRAFPCRHRNLPNEKSISPNVETGRKNVIPLHTATSTTLFCQEGNKASGLSNWKSYVSNWATDHCSMKKKITFK